MNAFENLLTRRSIRQYKQDPIPEEVLNKILEAGTYAPTGMNKQAPIIIAVTNREMRDRLSKMNAAMMGADNDPFYGARSATASAVYVWAHWCAAMPR